MNITITQLPSTAWQQYKDLRLQAVKTDPHAFGVSYEEEVARPDTQWQEHSANMWFALVDDAVVGMIGLLRNPHTPMKHCAHVISLWVKPAYRGHGIGKKLLVHLQQVARELGLRKLYLYVTTTQEQAIGLYKAVGFRLVGTLKEHTKWGDAYFDQHLFEWLVP